MNNMLGDCYAAVVIEKMSQKELQGIPEEPKPEKEEEIPMVDNVV